MKRKVLASLLCVAMGVTMIGSTAVFAEDAAEETTDEAATEENAEAEDADAEEAADDTAEAASDVLAKPDMEGVDVENAKIGISIYQFTDNFMTLYRTELVRYLTEDLGFNPDNVIVQDGKNDQAEQTNQINNFITDQVDVMILNLVQSSSAPQVTDMCNEAGIPVVYINRQPDETESDRWASDGLKATYIGADARQSGTFQGEEILETENKGDINGDGKVSYIMVQGDPENIDAQYRTEYSIKALTDAGVEVDELLLQRGDWDQAKGQQIVQDALTQYGDDVEVVFCNNDAMALGALQAIQAAGRTVGKDIYLVGVDALTDAVQNIVDGNFTGTVFNDYFSQAQGAANLAVKFLKGEEVDPVNMVDYVKVTADNAQEILDKIK
ncbi:MAG: substrate-binding domain-containing protein [Blautia glucerasea]|uniref:Substrate-binding domain-containing protein n=1 Tax=Blautia ammoniilytica TaxID=2981782 RepID=A0ABT2TR33_9FIRM|nr:substrate-binding domain-containing protein [Blautia ammoniilytica]MCI7628404.1 substrate-binding domain-containing protein [Blautia glucerasea]MCU6764674.1 substrate-binding domain-containing protein [Blautia ammoniilytica]MDY3086219.1 substrate-binding domain-containing protein [Blautia sp.]SCH54014.1 D-galactose/ D-glucose-binding protein [uncultured Blautia sp.]